MLGSVLVTQSCPTIWNRLDCGLPGSSVHGILQSRILEGVAIPFFMVIDQSLLLTTCLLFSSTIRIWYLKGFLLTPGILAVNHLLKCNPRNRITFGKKKKKVIKPNSHTSKTEKRGSPKVMHLICS